MEPLFVRSDTRLAEKGMVRMIADTKPGFPCRISLTDAEIGEEVLLLPYVHHNSGSPYHASEPVFRRNDRPASLAVNEIPEMLLHRLLSVMAYDSAGMMRLARVVKGKALQMAIYELFENTHITYLHIHNAGPGCFNCQVYRFG